MSSPLNLLNLLNFFNLFKTMLIKYLRDLHADLRNLRETHKRTEAHMKIAFLGPAPPLRGGISQFALSLAYTWLAEGHQVKMFGFRRQYPALIFPGKSQTAEFILPSKLEIDNCYIPYRPDTWPRAVKKIRDYQPNILIVSYFIPFFSPSYIMICRALKGVRITALLHNLVPHEPWLGARFLAQVFLEQCDNIICLSTATLNELRSLMPNRVVSKASLGFHPVYDQYLQTLDVAMAREPHTMLFFGLIKKYKGLDILLKAMPIVLTAVPDAKLLIAGEIYGSDQTYTALIRELGIEARVEAHFSYIPDSSVAGFFQRASLCVLPYRSASQSGVIALSYAFDLPVLASRLEGLEQYVDEGRTGLLVNAVPEPRPEDLARELIRYFKGSLYETMTPYVSKKGAEFSWSRLGKIIIGPGVNSSGKLASGDSSADFIKSLHNSGES